MCSSSLGVGSESEAWVGHMSAMPNKTKKDKVMCISSKGSCSFASWLSSNKHIIDEPEKQRLAH